MINLLQSSPDILRLITSSAATVDVLVSYMDVTTASPPVAASPGRQLTSISSATTTTILATPASGYIRNAKTIHIYNKDASTPITVTVVYDFNTGASTYKLWSCLLRAGESLEYIEGIGWFVLADSNAAGDIIKVLTADDTGGTAGNSVQPWFPTNGTLTVPAATTYRMEGLLKITSGATSHSTGLSIGGTATLTSLDYYAQAHRSAADTIISVFSGIHIASAANATVDVAGTQAAHYILINGILRINAAGTIIPQFTFSANPTGTITIKRNSFFRLRAIGDNTLATLGSWA